MSDVALHWNASTFLGDFALDANDLEIDEGLQTAVFLSLFCDRRAERGDVLPFGETSRRGWWADGLLVDGDRIGSRLWLLDREKNTPDVLPRAELYAREALQWFVDDKIAERVDVSVEFITDGSGRVNGYAIFGQVQRPGVDPVLFRFNRLWVAEEERN